MELLAPYRDRLKISVHFNLAEGHCMAEPEQVPLLVDERGMFHISFFKVLLLSVLGMPENFQEIARRKNLPLEVLSHPGGVERPDALMDLQNRDCVAFYLSEGRKAEKRMLMKIGVKQK